LLSAVQRLLGYENAAQLMYGDITEQEDNYIGDISGWAAAAGGGDEQQRQSSSGGKDSSSAARRALSAGIARLLMQLQDNLEAKSRAYKNEAIAALFMMNNVHYVQWSVESSAALGLLGGAWLERHKDMVEDWGARYHDITWMPIINMLKVAGGQWLHAHGAASSYVVLLLFCWQQLAVLYKMLQMC
jgi:exocyst complex protein 7